MQLLETGIFFLVNFDMGPFNNYVDKMRGEGGGQKMSVFIHAQGIKTVQGVKMAKFIPRSC